MTDPNISNDDARTSLSQEEELLATVMSEIQYERMNRDQNCPESAEEYNSEEASSEETNSSDDDVSPGDVQAYKFDPKMTPERRRQKEEERKSKEKELEKRSKPVEEWCTCDNCVIMERVLENVCCSEDIYVKDKLQESNAKCIVNHDGFEPTVLNEHVLNMTRQRLLGMVKDPDKKHKLKSDSNDTLRFLSYSNFRHWICSGHKLGKGNRLVTPSCVVKVIREKWPSHDGIYVGFHTRYNSDDDI